MSIVRRIEFSAPIWKTAFDLTKGWLVLELRDADVLQAEFTVVDLSQGQVVNSGIRLPERWWVSLMSAANGRFIVRQFLQTIQTTQFGKTWEVEVKSDANSRIVELPRPVEQEILNPELPIPTQKEEQLIVPFHYIVGSEHYQTLFDFLEQKLKISPVGPIEYLEMNSQLLFSYYLSEGAGFVNYFVNFGSNGQSAEPYRLASELSGFGQDTFSVWQSKLVLCVTDHKCLSLIDL